MKKSVKKSKPMVSGSGSQFIMKKGGSKKPMMKKGGMMKRGC